MPGLLTGTGTNRARICPPLPAYLASHPRHLFVVGANAQISIAEAYASPSCDLYFTNAVTEVDVERSGRLAMVRLEAESGTGEIALRMIVEEENRQFVRPVVGKDLSQAWFIRWDAEGKGAQVGRVKLK